LWYNNIIQIIKKKLILLLITLTTLTNVSYASFPVIANDASDPLPIIPILSGILFLTGFGFAIYFLFRLYKNSFNPSWVRFLGIFGIIIFSILSILFILFFMFLAGNDFDLSSSGG